MNHNFQDLKFSEDFCNKAKKSGLTDESNEFNWIWKSILTGEEIDKIIEKFFIHTEWDGNYLTDSSSGILNLFLTLKNRGKIFRSEYNYLRNKSGMITVKSASKKSSIEDEDEIEDKDENDDKIEDKDENDDKIEDKDEDEDDKQHIFTCLDLIEELGGTDGIKFIKFLREEKFNK
jgi:hypothetical protein